MEEAMGDGDIGALAEMICRDRPDVDNLVLEPDGKFQTARGTTHEFQRQVVDDLKQSFDGFSTADFPVLMCGWGKARVGSTALNNLFGLAGLPSYYQPIKALLRHRLQGGRGPGWSIPRADRQPYIFSKEVAGPYLLAECLYNPVRILVDAGFPAARMHVLLLDRRPLDCLASWYEKWSDRVPQERLLRHQILASLNVCRIEATARRLGIPVTHFVYELSREAVGAARALFIRLGLADRFHEEVVTDWKDHGDLDTDETGVIYPDEPAIFAVPGLHGADCRYRFHDRGGGVRDPVTRRMLEDCGVFETYRRSVQASVADLGLGQAVEDRLLADL
jgi:hypothetical protein